MGIEYSIYRKSPAGRFELGKPSMTVEPKGDAPPMPLFSIPLGEKWKAWHLACVRHFDPSYPLWSLMGDAGNYETFRLSDADLPRLKEALAPFLGEDRAQSIINWSKGSELLIIPDTDDEKDILKKFGFPQTQPLTGSIYQKSV